MYYIIITISIQTTKRIEYYEQWSSLFTPPTQLLCGFHCTVFYLKKKTFGHPILFLCNFIILSCISMVLCFEIPFGFACFYMYVKC